MISNSLLIQGIIDDIDINKISNPENLAYHHLREVEERYFENDELALSIKQKGLLQPIIVRPKHTKFEVIAGHKRLLACKKLGWKKIACHVVEANDKEAFEILLIENIQRKTLSPIAEAHAFKAYVSDFGYGGVSELASRIGKSPSYITRRIKLLDLHPTLLDSIANSEISTSIAEELCFIKDKPKQAKMADVISVGKLSFRETREMLKNIQKEDSSDIADGHNCFDTVEDRLKRVQDTLDKTILILRIALNRLGTIIENADDRDWMIKEVLMQHRNVINTQIDLLIKEKKKLKTNAFYQATLTTKMMADQISGST